MLRIRLRETGAALIVTAFICLVVFFAWLADRPPAGRPKNVDAVIAGFDTSYSRASLQRQLRGLVRLPNGQIERLDWSVLVADCRRGDVVRLEQYDHGQFRVPPQRCHPQD